MKAKVGGSNEHYFSVLTSMPLFLTIVYKPQDKVTCAHHILPKYSEVVHTSHTILIHTLY
jgi:hypothetical protein